jgi:uncharacterized protein DUF5660
MSDPFQFPNPYAGKQNNQQTAQKKVQPNNFLEAFKEQGRTATSGVVSNAVDQITGVSNINPQVQQAETKPAQNLNQKFNFAEFLRLREQKVRQQERGLVEQQRHTETIIFHQKEDKAKKEIEAIKIEIQKIIEVSKGLGGQAREIERTVATNTVVAGVYQSNFFERVLKLLVTIKKQLSESKNWLETFNSRRTNRSHYWGNVKKSGAKYMLSNERYVATQAG